MHEPNTDATREPVDSPGPPTSDDGHRGRALPLREASPPETRLREANLRETSVRTTLWVGAGLAVSGIAVSALGWSLGRALVLSGLVFLVWGVHRLGRLGPAPAFSWDEPTSPSSSGDATATAPLSASTASASTASASTASASTASVTASPAALAPPTKGPADVD